MEQESLKPCPFCGGEAEAWEYEDEQDVFDPISLGWIDSRCITYHCVGCESCEIEVSRLSKDDAMTAWNARAAVDDEQFARAVHDGEAWQKVRTCENVLDHSPCAFECSECGFSVRTVPDGPADWQTPFWRHCPNCGAKVVV